MLRGKVLKARAPLNLKLPWYLVVLARGKRSRSPGVISMDLVHIHCPYLKPLSIHKMVRRTDLGLTLTGHQIPCEKFVNSK